MCRQTNSSEIPIASCTEVFQNLPEAVMSSVQGLTFKIDKGLGAKLGLPQYDTRRIERRIEIGKCALSQSYAIQRRAAIPNWSAIGPDVFKRKPPQPLIQKAAGQFDKGQEPVTNRDACNGKLASIFGPDHHMILEMDRMDVRQRRFQRGNRILQNHLRIAVVVECLAPCFGTTDLRFL